MELSQGKEMSVAKQKERAKGVINQKLHRGLIPRPNYLWVGLSRFLEALSFLDVMLIDVIRCAELLLV